MRIFKSIGFALIGIVIALGILAAKAVFKSGPTGLVSSSPSKADQRILRARQTIEKMPSKSEGYNQLAAAYIQKARETSEFAFNANADEAITRSLAIEPDNYDALKLRAKLQLTYHRFNEAS